MENVKITLFCLISLLVMVIGVIFFNKVASSNDDSNNNENTNEKLDYNNVSIIDAKLGDDIKVTQSYLMNYIIKKSGIWYESNGIIKSIVNKDNVSYITISNENNSIIGVIDKDKVNVKKDDIVNFVGTMDIENKYIRLSKISIDDINYNSSTKISLNDLVNNINLVTSNYFIVSGYLVTEDSNYKLFDSKKDYQENNKAGYYFRINWDGKFEYTGNQDVNIRCNISNSYTLKNCTLIN